MNKDIRQMTKRQLKKLEYIKPIELFNAVAIVPMGNSHDSGFGCMKYILLNNFKIIGVVGGKSDVLHINGFGGYGDIEAVNKAIKNHRKGYDWRIDCLSKSQCLRLFSDELCRCDDFIYSDFCIYVKDGAKKGIK